MPSPATTASTAAATPQDTDPSGGGLAVPLLLVLALLAAVAPFATDLYLPAFPEMADEFGAGASAIQLTLTAFLCGAGLGQLVFGPLSDRFGRRRPLLVGATALVAASLVAALAPTLPVLVAARFVQGLSAAAGMVLARAVIADLTRGAAAARAFSLMMIVVGVAPVVAPLVGGLLSGLIGWRGVLGVVCGIAVLMLVAAAAFVPESLPPSARAAAAGSGRWRALRSRGYLGHALAFGFGFGVLMSYISASPFLYQSMMGLSELQYGLMFGLNAVAMMTASGLSARNAAVFGPTRMLGWGLTATLVGSVLVLLVAVSGLPASWLAVAVLVAVAPIGLVMGNATALAQGAAPGAAGSAAAVQGALQFGLAALVSPLVGIAGEDSAVPLGIAMVVMAVVALSASRVARGAVPAPVPTGAAVVDPA